MLWCEKLSRALEIPMGDQQVAEVSMNDVVEDSPEHAVFLRNIHREIAPAINAVPMAMPGTAGSLGQRFTASPSFDNIMGRKHSGNPLSKLQPTRARTDTATRLGTVSNHSDPVRKPWYLSVSGLTPFQHVQTPTMDLAAHPMRYQQTPSLGGIMVSQEVNVDVADADKMNEETQSDLLPILNERSDRFSGRFSVDHSTILTEDSKRTSAATLEMKTLPQFPRAVVYAGPDWRSAVIGTEDVLEARTFVDELFAVCINERR
jgi:hypothetical protein